MTPAARTKYHAELWPAACEAQRWSHRDEVRRRHVTGDCMAKIRGPATESTTDLGPDEVTALFCYLEHLANPNSLEHSQRWVDCQTDYRAYNRAKQADWHQRQAYGSRGRKLTRNRFGGEATAVGAPQEVFDPKKINQRFWTMANRHKAKARKQAPGDLRRSIETIQNPAGAVAATPVTKEPDPF